MFIDASVVVAVLAKEPGFEELRNRLFSAARPLFVSPTVRFEAALGLARNKSASRASAGTSSAGLLEQARSAVDAFVEALEIDEVPITSEIGTMAIDASVRYGKGSGHAARLNFGDCFAYACAKVLRVPLLYKGDDFAHTDLALSS